MINQKISVSALKIALIFNCRREEIRKQTDCSAKQLWWEIVVVYKRTNFKRSRNRENDQAYVCVGLASVDHYSEI